MKTYKILSIDAWADCCGCDHTENDMARCWTWNQWYTIGHCADIPNTIEEAFKLVDGDASKLNEYYLDDDQYNIVITEKKTNMPIIAFEYGSQS